MFLASERQHPFWVTFRPCAMNKQIPPTHETHNYSGIPICHLPSWARTGKPGFPHPAFLAQACRGPLLVTARSLGRFACFQAKLISCLRWNIKVHHLFIALLVLSNTPSHSLSVPRSLRKRGGGQRCTLAVSATCTHERTPCLPHRCCAPPVG